MSTHLDAFMSRYDKEGEGIHQEVKEPLHASPQSVFSRDS